MLHGVYGLYANPKTNHIAKLLTKLTELGIENKEYQYLKLWAIDTYYHSLIKTSMRRLISDLKDGDSIAAHSFGCVITLLTLEYLHTKNIPLQLNHIYLFNPSINRDYIIQPTKASQVYVFHDPKDRLLKIARWVPFNILGDMGKVGYHSPNHQIHNITVNDSYPEKGYNHWRFLDEPGLTDSANFIYERENRTEITRDSKELTSNRGIVSTIERSI